MTQSITDKAKALQAQVDSFQLFHWKNYVKYGRLATLLVIGGLTLSVSTTASAFLGHATIAGFLGLGTTLFIGLYDAFNFADKSSFFGEIHAEAKTLRDRLRYRANSEEEFNSTFDDFQLLRKRASKDVPKGKGISVAKRGPNEA